MKRLMTWWRCRKGHDVAWFYWHRLDGRTEAQFLRIGQCRRCKKLVVEPDPRKETP